MKAPLAIVVATVFAVAGVAVWLVGSQEEKEAQLLFPELTIETLNAVRQIEIVQRGNPPINMYLASDEVWRVAEHYDHPADTAMIREMLTALNSAEKIERKTSQPEYYAMLGVGDPTAEEVGEEEEDENDGRNESKLFTFKTPDETRRLIIGKSSDQVKNGHYVRKPEEAESWLISARLPLRTRASGWLDRQVVDIEPDSLSTITITPAGDSEPFTIARGGHGLFELVGLEKQSEMKNPFGFRGVASVTERLRFRGVFPREGETAVQLPDQHITAVFQTTDGLAVTIRAYKASEHTMYFQLEADGDNEQARELRQRLPKWTYEIASLIYNNLDKTRDSFLKDESDDPS